MQADGERGRSGKSASSSSKAGKRNLSTAQDPSKKEGNKKRQRNLSRNIKFKKHEESDDDMDDDDVESEAEEEIIDNNDDEMMDVEDGKKAVYRPGVDELGEDEELDYDPSTYDLYAKLALDWPCLTLDVLNDGKGFGRTQYPMECTVIAGTQAEKPEDNRIYIMKWTKLHETKEDDSDEDSDEEEEDEDPEMDHHVICHPHTVNRIRAMPQGNLCATWSECGNVFMWSLKEEVAELEKGNSCSSNYNKKKPLFAYNQHEVEGFALAWNPHVIGRFLSGDNNGVIKQWAPREGGWQVDENAFTGSRSSVEDLMWKKKGAGCEDVFASASVDGCVRIYDVREKTRSEQLKIKAHERDVNVLAWNPLVGELIATGSDDGSFKVYDIRHGNEHMAHFEYHNAPITSVSWHPTEETALCVSSADNTVTLWDMAVEEDEDDEGQEQLEGVEEFPPQLLFLHQGQKSIMETMWHPQLPGVVISTALDGFNIFKPNNF